MAEGSPFCEHRRAMEHSPLQVKLDDGFVLTWPMDLKGFYARPMKGADGTLDLLVWEAGIPGKKDVSMHSWIGKGWKWKRWR